MFGRLSILSGVLWEGIVEYYEKHERKIVPVLIMMYFSSSSTFVY